MTNDFTLRPISPTDPTHTDAIAGLWTAACGGDLAASRRLAAYNVSPVTGGVQAGRFAWLNDEPVGVVLCSGLPDRPQVAPPDVGWIDAIAVLPEAQRSGIGSTLLQWAEAWLADQGFRCARLGGNLHPFVPGLPVALETDPFFAARGYTHTGAVWDVAADLSRYTPPATLRQVEAAARPVQPGEEEALLDFLHREFPGRWRFECEEFLQNGGRASDYMLLWTERGVNGFCQLTFTDSVRPIERFYPYQLLRPWGQLGPIGINADRRGEGLGAAMLDAGLRRLHNNGVNGCVIDWTTHLDFYGKFGFTPYREYGQWQKTLAPQN